jgi:hypothetical protein
VRQSRIHSGPGAPRIHFISTTPEADSLRTRFAKPDKTYTGVCFYAIRRGNRGILLSGEMIGGESRAVAETVSLAHGLQFWMMKKARHFLVA